MADIIPITTYVDITVRDSVPNVYADAKKGLILTTGSFNPDWAEEYQGNNALADIGADWGLNHNVYKAASSYFSQTPKPGTLLIGTYSDTIPSTVYGGTPNSIEDISAITDGAMAITTESGTTIITDLDFSSCLSLNDALAVIKDGIKREGVNIPVKFGAIGFELYGATAFPSDIPSIAATSGYLESGAIDDLSSFQAITNGGFKVPIDGVLTAISGIILGDTQAILTGGASPADPSSLSASDYRVALSLGGASYETDDINISGLTTGAEVASAIQTAFNTASIPASIEFTESVYVIKSVAIGDVTITTTEAPSSGTDLGTLLKLDVAGSATAENGVAKVESFSEVASRISSEVPGATCVYNPSTGKLLLTSDTSGASSSIGFSLAPDSGQDLSIPTAWREGLGAVTVPGEAVKTPDATVALLGLVATATNARIAPKETGVLPQRALDEIYRNNSGWMILTVTKEFRDQNKVFAAWCETKGDRIFIAQDQKTNTLEPDEGGDILNFSLGGYSCGTAFYHSQAYENEYLDAGISGWISGMNLSLAAGYENLTFKSITGITADSIGDPNGIKSLNGNYYATAGAAGEAVKDICYPGKMANGLLVTEKIANTAMQQDLQNAVFSVLSETGNVPLSSRGAALVKTALETQMESKWKVNGYVPENGGEYQDAAGNVTFLPKGYAFNVYTTLASRAANQFLVDGTILKEGSVILVTGSITVQQAT